MSNSKFQIKSQIPNPKRLITVLTVFVAGLGLSALAVGTVWVRAYQSYTSSTSYTSYRSDTADESNKGEWSDEVGFRDPLITLVKPTAAYRAETPLRPSVTEDDPVWGDSAAPVRIVVFGDLADGATKEAWQELYAVWETHQDAVQLVWKDFPNPLNPGSREAALAARCVQEQGQFSTLLESLFGIPYSKFEDVITKLDLDEEAYAACMRSSEAIGLVNRGMEEAQALDIDAVPAVFVGPYRMTGTIGAENVERLVGLIQ